MRKYFPLLALLYLSSTCLLSYWNPPIATASPQPSVYLPIVTQAPTAAMPPLPLSQVRYWAYQIQGLDLPGAQDALAASRYDLLVLEPTRTDWSSEESRRFDTAGMLARLKNTPASSAAAHRKLIVAYLNIGQAEDWRWYWTWSTGWDCRGPRPADWPTYILTCDPDGWDGNYPVAYWDPRWKDLVLYGQNTPAQADRNYASMLDELVLDGFDGVYLDWVEAFENDAVIAAAQQAGLDPAAAMLAFLQELRAYARSRHPGFLVIQQNAAALADGRPALFQTIDAIAQEEIWYAGEATDAWDDPAGYDLPVDPALTAEYIAWLDQYRAAGLPVFNCEYALQHAPAVYANAAPLGYIAYATRRSLSQLTTTPPDIK